MKSSIWIYGGVHHNPGSRRRFLEELSKQETAPHFVAVEWEKFVFEKFVQIPYMGRLKSLRDNRIELFNCSVQFE
jgi:hypothetical protein